MSMLTDYAYNLIHEMGQAIDSGEVDLIKRFEAGQYDEPEWVPEDVAQ